MLQRLRSKFARGAIGAACVCRLWDPATGRLAETLQLTQPTLTGSAPAVTADKRDAHPAASSAVVTAADSAAPVHDAAADDPDEEAAAQRGQEADEDGGDEDGRPLAATITHPAVLAIAVSPSGCASSLQRPCQVSLLRCVVQLLNEPVNADAELLALWCSRTIAAAVEGEDEVLVLHAVLRRGRSCGLPKGVLSMSQRLVLPDFRQPFALTFQPGGRLWAAGMASSDADDRSMVLRCADRVVGDAADADKAEVMLKLVNVMVCRHAACTVRVTSLSAPMKAGTGDSSRQATCLLDVDGQA